MSALIANAVNLIRNQTTGAVQDISTEDVHTFVIERQNFHAWLENEERRTSCTFYYRTTGNAFIKNKDFFRLYGPLQPANAKYRAGFALSPKDGPELERTSTDAGVKRGRACETNYSGVKYQHNYRIVLDVASL